VAVALRGLVVANLVPPCSANHFTGCRRR
jgi:hypothetical protein